MARLSEPVIFGEVLYDCFPDGNSVLGGAPFNVAWHCQAFGLKPLFISRVGDDDKGKEILAAMKEWGMRIDGIQLDHQHPTGQVDIEFINGEPQYDIVENSAWDFIQADQLPEIESAGLIYHGSLALRNPVSEAAIRELKQNPCPVFIDINLRSPWWNKQSIVRLVSDCKWLKLNEDELFEIEGHDVPTDDAIKRIFTKGPLDTLVVTQGDKGVITCGSDQIITRLPPVKATEVVDTVGAGDAFSSVFLLGIYCKWDLLTTVNRAQQFASEIVQQQGATISDKTFYQEFIQQWNVRLE